MKTLNEATIIGVVGDTPVVKELDKGKKMATFHVATDNYYKKGEEGMKETDWHNIVCWENNANVAEWLIKKGSIVFIRGRIKTVNRGTEEDKRFFTEIVADSIFVFSNDKK